MLRDCKMKLTEHTVNWSGILNLIWKYVRSLYGW